MEGSLAHLVKGGDVALSIQDINNILPNLAEKLAVQCYMYRLQPSNEDDSQNIKRGWGKAQTEPEAESGGRPSPRAITYLYSVSMVIGLEPDVNVFEQSWVAR